MDKKSMNANRSNRPINDNISNRELIITERDSAVPPIRSIIVDDDINSPTSMTLFDYIYNRSFLPFKYIQFFGIDGKLTHKFVDNDLYIIVNIFKSWYNNQIDLEYKEVYAMEKLYKENPNLLKETILLDISKRTKFANIDNTKITNINHPNYKIRKGLKYD